MTKVFKVEVLIVDHDNLDKVGVVEVIEGSHYPNRCIMPKVMKIEAREVEWSDEHPLNNYNTMRQTYEDLFK